MTGNKPIYVYGVVSGGVPITLPEDGVASATPRLLESNGLAAIVSDVPGERLRVRRRDLSAHLRALEEVFAQTTVVPCRFGTVLPSEGEVRAHLLDARRDELHGLLERLKDHVQLNLKAVYEEPEVLSDLVAADPRIAAGRQRARDLGEAAYYANIELGELVTAQLVERRGRDAYRIHARLAALASDVVADDKDTDALLVLKASYLVDRKRANQFDSEVESLAKTEAPAIRFELVGPLPPTAFASLGGDG